MKGCTQAHKSLRVFLGAQQQLWLSFCSSFSDYPIFLPPVLAGKGLRERESRIGPAVLLYNVVGSPYIITLGAITFTMWVFPSRTLRDHCCSVREDKTHLPKFSSRVAYYVDESMPRYGWCI